MPSVRIPFARYSPAQISVSVVVIVLGAAISAAALVSARSAEEERIQALLDFRADWHANDIENYFKSSFAIVLSVATMVATSAETSAATFDSFVIRRFSYGHAHAREVFWAPRARQFASPEARPATLARELPESEITEREGDRPRPAPIYAESYPTAFGVTFEGRGPAIGVDFANDEGRRTAIQHAIDFGDVGAVALTVAASTPHQRSSLIAYAPVYDAMDIPNSVEARRASVRGIVGATFDLERILNLSIENTPEIVEEVFVLHGPPVAGDPMNIAASYVPGQRRFIVDSIPTLDLAALSGYRALRSFNVGGETWHVVFHFPAEQVEALRTFGPWAWLFVGFLVTLGIGSITVAAQGRGSRLRKLVDHRTAEIFDLNAQLRDRLADLEAIVNSSPMAIVALDADGLIRSISPAAERTYGVTAKEAVGRKFLSATDSDQAGEAEGELVRRRVLGGASVAGVEFSRLSKDGKTIHTRVSGSPLLDATQGVSGAVFLVEDITEQKAIAEELQHVQKLDAIGQLTGGLAHDFNNLLGVIVGNLDMLSEAIGGENPGNAELVADALSAALKGADLTRSLLAFARRQPLQTRTIDANLILDSAAGLIGRMLGEQFKIVYDKKANLWPTVADPVQLEAAVLNLYLNARDAMPGGGTLTVETRNVHLDKSYVERTPQARIGDHVLISVTDTGTGMSKQVMARALEPFFTTKEVGKGSGLGLSMVFGFVKQSGGHFELYSEVGHGTTAKIYLPRATATDVPVALGPSEATPDAVGHETILVVDDNERMRKVVVKQLLELHYRTIEAADGPGALRILAGSAEVDLLFTDMIMPGGMTGYQLASSARALRPSLRILFTSGFPAAALDGGRDLSVNGSLLSKPYRRKDLAQHLRAALDTPLEGAL